MSVKQLSLSLSIRFYRINTSLFRYSFIDILLLVSSLFATWFSPIFLADSSWMTLILDCRQAFPPLLYLSLLTGIPYV